MFMHGVEIDVDIANKIFEDKEIDFVVCNKEYYSEFLSELFKSKLC